MKVIISFLSFVLLSFFLQAQENENDSIHFYFNQINELIKDKKKYPSEFLNTNYLLETLKNQKGEDKVNTLLKLHMAYAFNSQEIARKYNDEALRLSSQLHFKKGEFRAYYNRAYFLFVKGDFEEALNMVLYEDGLIDYTKYPEVYADMTTLKSDIYTERGQYDLAIESGLKLLDVAEKTKNDYLFMKANAALSHYYLRTENFLLARSYCLKGLKYIIKLKKTEYIYSKINEIARMTLKIEGAERALEVYELFSIVEKNTRPPSDYVMSITYMIKSDIYKEKGDLDKVQSYLNEALKLNYKNDFNFRIPRALTQMAELNLVMKDTANAILNYTKSIEQAEIINAFDVLKSNSSILSKLYKKKKEFANAYEYQTLNEALRDSLFTNEKEQKISILEARRRIKEVTHQKQILELENEAQQRRYETFIIFFICLSILSGCMIFGYVKVRRKKELLFQRTIELTEMQLKMQERLAGFKEGRLPQEVHQSLSDTSSNQTLDDEVCDIILNKLNNLEKELFFIESNCSLRQLSSQLKTNPKYLSQVINQEKKSNFNNYINGLRINYLLQKLLKDEDFRNSKLSYIAVSVGYNNSNTFNTAFKKRLGILPSYFINQLNNESKGVGVVHDIASMLELDPSAFPKGA